MAPNFQSSFIPKEPVTEEVFKKKKAGIFGILAVSIFIGSIVIAIGLYVYKGILGNDIKSLESELAASEQSIDTKTINQISQFSKKLGMVKSIVQNHEVVSNFLSALSSSTISTVQFTDLEYGSLDKGVLGVDLKGKAASYSSIAEQEQILNQNKYFQAISFSDLSLTDKGTVAFDLKISLNPAISVYSPMQTN